MSGESLRGRWVVITRPADRASRDARRIAALGGHPVELPAVEIAGPPEASELARILEDLSVYDWIVFTSPRAVAAVRGQLLDFGEVLSQATAKLAAVGGATARALTESGLEVQKVPALENGLALARELGEGPGRVLLPRSSRARPELPEALADAGFDVEEVVAYQTLLRPVDPEVLRSLRRLDAVLFASPSAVGGFWARLSPAELSGWHPGVRCGAIGATTAFALRAFGVRDPWIPSTPQGLIAELPGLFEGD